MYHIQEFLKKLALEYDFLKLETDGSENIIMLTGDKSTHKIIVVKNTHRRTLKVSYCGETHVMFGSIFTNCITDELDYEKDTGHYISNELEFFVAMMIFSLERDSRGSVFSRNWLFGRYIEKLNIDKDGSETKHKSQFLSFLRLNKERVEGRVDISPKMISEKIKLLNHQENVLGIPDDVI